VCLREGLDDRRFLEKHARGLESLTEAAGAWPAPRAAELCGVDPGLLEQVPRELARRRQVFFRVGWGLERNRNGTDAVRAVFMLRALLGRFDGPACGVALSTSQGYRMDFSKAEAAHLRVKPSRQLNMSQLARVLDETKDPPVKLLYVYNCNPVATAPNQTRLARALGRESLFTVVHEQVLTDTCAFADLVLPATTFLEHKELCRSYGGYALQWTDALVKPRGEARPNHAVFAALAKALGLDEPELRASEEDIARAALAGTRGVETTLEDLREKSYIPVKPLTQFVDVFPSRGHVDLAGAAPPRYRPAPAGAELPLVLVSPASDRAITSTLFEGLTPGTARLSISPADAAARGVRSGDLVRARNEFGEVVAELEVDEDLRPGVASLPKGLWRRATKNGSTANALAPDHVDELGGGACYNDARVEVTRA
jgi:anaerobic selenocysteine-containing dehydrogenase